MQINRSRLGCGSRFNILRLWGMRFEGKRRWHIFTPLFAIGVSPNNIRTGEMVTTVNVGILCRWRSSWVDNYMFGRQWCLRDKRRRPSNSSYPG